MANRKFRLGMLVMVLIFGMMVFGCDADGGAETEDGIKIVAIVIPFSGQVNIHFDKIIRSSTFPVGVEVDFRVFVDGSEVTLSYAVRGDVYDGSAALTHIGLGIDDFTFENSETYNIKIIPFHNSSFCIEHLKLWYV